MPTLQNAWCFDSGELILRKWSRKKAWRICSTGGEGRVSMGSLGAGDGVGLFFGWMMRPRNPGEIRRRSDFVGGWRAMAASSKLRLGLFATGTQLQLLDFFSSSSGVNEPRSRSARSERGGHNAVKRHCQNWPHGLLPSIGGGAGSPPDWSVGILLSRPWASSFLGQGWGPGRGNVVATAHGRGDDGSPPEPPEKRYPIRTLTNVIIGLNILVFLGQIASNGRLLLWGAKVNSLIDQGEYWRLLTPCILHANMFHLLINTYSLNSIGPTVESLEGPTRFLVLYSTSALTSSTLSYFRCSVPSVGASGAIFGLVGALAVFLLRHKNMMVGGDQSLQQVTRVIGINLALGLVSGGIDNWGHLGGLVGGAAVTWLLGPVYTFELPPGGGQREVVDRPPISYLLPSQGKRK